MSAQASRQHSCMMPLWLLWYHCFYACPNPTFLCRPCWWATPTGDPNAGKSPLFGFKSKFEKACSAAAASLLPNHTCGAGNLGKFQEKLAGTHAVGLLRALSPSLCWTQFSFQRNRGYRNLLTPPDSWSVPRRLAPQAEDSQTRKENF